LRALPLLLVALLAACSTPPAPQQAAAQQAAPTSTTTYKIGNRSFDCVTTYSGAEQASRCIEQDGPYISLCVGTLTNGALRQACSDNYGNTWDPGVTAAPPLPPASQSPRSSVPTPPEQPR